LKRRINRLAAKYAAACIPAQHSIEAAWESEKQAHAENVNWLDATRAPRVSFRHSRPDIEFQYSSLSLLRLMLRRFGHA
jgi:hypothetical protein